MDGSDDDVCDRLQAASEAVIQLVIQAGALIEVAEATGTNALTQATGTNALTQATGTNVLQQIAYAGKEREYTEWAASLGTRLRVAREAFAAAKSAIPSSPSSAKRYGESAAGTGIAARNAHQAGMSFGMSVWKPIRSISGASETEADEYTASVDAIQEQWPSIKSWLTEKFRGIDVKLLLAEIGAESDMAIASRKAEQGKGDGETALTMMPAKLDKSEGTGGGGSEPGQEQSPPASTREPVLRQLKSSVRKAYLAFLYAETMKGRRLEDSEAYGWLCEHGIDQSKDGLGELTDYKLPDSLETFRRYLSTARKALDENKYTRRGGRKHGGSIVRGNEIEYQKGDDR